MRGGDKTKHLPEAGAAREGGSGTIAPVKKKGAWREDQRELPSCRFSELNRHH